MMKNMSKKCSTDQRFIRKRNTAYEIGTLVSWVFWSHWVHKKGLLYSKEIPKNALPNL